MDADMHKLVLIFALSFAAPEEWKVNATLTAHDQVRQFKGKRVTLVLRSGKELDGTVGEVSGSNVVVERLVGKDNYDALVKIEDISAFVYKAR
jgi:small nuclear ribonucleoprotein (snRNP)-like protein